MKLNHNDRAVIENALKHMMNQGTNYQEMMHCREVLTKLQHMPHTDAAQMSQQDAIKHTSQFT